MRSAPTNLETVSVSASSHNPSISQLARPATAPPPRRLAGSLPQALTSTAPPIPFPPAHPHSSGARTLPQGKLTQPSGARTHHRGAHTFTNPALTHRFGKPTLSQGARTYCQGARTLEKGALTLGKGAPTHSKGARTFSFGAHTFSNGALKNLASRHHILHIYNTLRPHSPFFAPLCVFCGHSIPPLPNPRSPPEPSPPDPSKTGHPITKNQPVPHPPHTTKCQLPTVNR